MTTQVGQSVFDEICQYEQANHLNVQIDKIKYDVTTCLQLLSSLDHKGSNYIFN